MQRQAIVPNAQELVQACARTKGEPGEKRARYMQLSDYMRDKIYTHDWPSGAKLPSEHTFMELTGVSRGTVRKAIKLLEDEGMLVSQQGRGTFVANAAISHPGGSRPLSFFESLRSQGTAFQTHVDIARVEPARQEVATALEMPPAGDVLYLRRVRHVEGRPVMCMESWYNLAVCPGIHEFDFEHASAFNAVEASSGRRITSSKMTYMARVAGEEHGRLLACDEAAPVLLLEQQIRLETDAVAEWSFTWLPAGQPVTGVAEQAI
jgi:DNA-binding GntR family transcriptional regulator